MIRSLSVLGVAMLCVSCRTDATTNLAQTEPLINTAEINARDDCLRREVARLIEPEGSSPTSLQVIAVSAASFCSNAIRAKLQGASSSAAREDQVKAEQFAFAIGLELREKRAR